MKVSELIKRLQKIRKESGDKTIGICDRNAQDVITIDSVSFVPEQGVVVIFADDQS
jgi:hypothetical protein